MTLRSCLTVAAWQLLGLLLLVVAATATVNTFLTVDEPLAPADAIVVLGGDGHEFQRTEHAIRLVEEEYAPTVVFTGPTPKEGNLACSGIQQSVRVARAQGLPEGAEITVSGADSTYDEAIILQRLVEEHGWRLLILVTDKYYTRRVVRTFRRINVEPPWLDAWVRRSA